MNPFNNPNQQQAMQFNPNFNNQNTQFANFNLPNTANFNLPNTNNFQGILNPNSQFQGVQNNQLGVLHLLAAQLQSNPQLQINLLNQLQNQILAATAAPFNQMGMPLMGLNPIQSINSLMGMPNGQLLAQNQLMGLLGNPQPGQNNIGLGFGNATMSSSPMKTQWNDQNVQQAGGSWQVQTLAVSPGVSNNIKGNHDDNSRVNSANSAYKSYGSGKEQSHNRFQKSQSHGMRSSIGIMKTFNKRGGGRGQHNWREQKSHSTNSGEEAPEVCWRPLPVNYTKTEIQLWREARKKNFPTRANIDRKKSTDSKNAEDADAKLRRQQLKEVLLKQAELGVEVAEIPRSYLCDPQEQVPENENEQEVTEGRPANRFNKKRGGRRGQDNRRSKRQKFKNKRQPTSPPSVKKEPSLLEKLLSADIKRDKSRLLQVFRFMVLNDFFKQWPDKPLEFPMITVKDGVDSAVDESTEKAMAVGIGYQKESSEVKEMENESDEEDEGGTVGISEVADLAEEQFEELEEGQITD